MSKTLDMTQILRFTPKQIRNGFRGTVRVRYSDGELIEMNHAEIVANRYMWQLCIDHLDGFVNSGMSLGSYYNHGIMDGGSMGKALSHIVKTIMKVKMDSHTFDKLSMIPVKQGIIDVVDLIHNELTYDLNEFVVVIDMLDLMDIQLYDPLLKAMVRLKKNICEDNVNKCYDEIAAYNHANKESGLALMMYSGSLKKAQINILAGPRGGISDIDGIPYKDVVTNSFMMGMTKASWYFQESRTAAAAFLQSKKAIEQSETLSKSIQVISAVVSSIDMEDCGSTNYRNVFIENDSEDKKSNLKDMNGKIYLNEDGVLEPLNDGMKFLHGTTIKIRSAHNCETKNPHNICMTCFGTLGLNLGHHVNIGHLGVTSLTNFITSNHLAKKHNIGSTFGSSPIIMNPELAIFFNVVDGASLGFNRETTERESYKLHINVLDVNIIMNSGMEEVTDEVHSSAIKTVTVVKEIKTETVPLVTKTTVQIIQDGRTGYLTDEFLRYAGKNVVLDRKVYVIDMSGWDISKKIMTLINKDYNFMVLTDEINKLVLNKRTKSHGNLYNNKDTFVNDLCKVINKRMNVNIAWIETFAYGFMRRSTDGRLARNVDNFTIDCKSVLQKRSWSATSSHDAFAQRIMNPELFKMVPVDHPSDVLFRADALFPTQRSKDAWKYQRI